MLEPVFIEKERVVSGNFIYWIIWYDYSNKRRGVNLLEWATVLSPYTIHGACLSDFIRKRQERRSEFIPLNEITAIIYNVDLEKRW